MISSHPISNNSESSILGLPTSLWFLSIGAFFLNLSSVIAFAIAPIFMRRQFGSSDLDAGMLEGTVEGFSLIVRSVTGVFSDFVGRRKLFLMWGYGISTLSRFLLAPATLISQVIASRICEKVGNGLQASPREAFISDVSSPSIIGRAYSLNKTWSTAGSLTGGIIIICLYLKDNNLDIRTLLWTSGCFAFVSTAILFLGVKDPKIERKKVRSTSIKEEWRTVFSEMKEFSAAFWGTIGVICLFKLGLFSGTFLMARLRDSNAVFMGLPLKQHEVLSNGVFQLFQCISCTLFAYPLGILFDRIDRRIVVGLGFSFMIVALIVFSQGKSVGYMYTGIIFYGLQYALHGSLMAWLSSKMPHHLHGTGFGIFFFTSGLSIIFTNLVLMRNLSKIYSIETAFIVIAALVLLAVFLIRFIPKSEEKRAKSL